MMEITFHVAYLTLTIPFVFVWLILFLVRKDTRNEQLYMSIAGAVLGPISEIIYFRDYWMPKSIFPIFIGNFPFMFEDLIFGFAIGGIAAVIYEVLFRKHLSKFSKKAEHTIKSFSLVILFVFVLTTSLFFGLNSIYASSIALLVTGIPIIFFRKDLLLDAVWSGLMVMLVMFVCYLVLYGLVISNSEELLKQGWLIYGTNLDMRISGIPITELAWGFAWGFLAGPWYEFMNRKKLVIIRK